MKDCWQQQHNDNRDKQEQSSTRSWQHNDNRE
jgi:hypothetical protein